MSPTKSSSSQENPPSLTHALVELSYMDTIRHTHIGPIACEANISRPNDSSLSWPNRYVAIQWMRVRTAKAISAAEHLARIGELDPAKKELRKWVEEFHREAFEIAANEDPLIVQLSVDLKECVDMLNEKKYNAYVENEMGVRVQSHFSQRCSEPMTGKVNVYRTGQKSLRAQAFKQQGSSMLKR